MKKNNKYFSDITASEVAREFTIPTATAVAWQKRENIDGDWRGHLIDRLKLFTIMQDDSTAKIKALFTENELMAILGSINCTIIGNEMVMSDKLLSYQFMDYCVYEDIEASQFGDLEVLQKSVLQKLSSLSSWDRYCLLEYLQNNQKEIFGEIGGEK